MKYMSVVLVTFFIMINLVQADVIMGIVPQKSSGQVLKLWQPIVDYLSQKSGEKIIFRTEKSVPKFEKVLYEGGYDFAYMNPYHYILAHKKQNYVARVRANQDIQGILVIKKGSMKIFQDKDVQYIFSTPNAFAATLLTKYDLAQKFGVSLEILNKAKYVNSHDSVYKAIARGVGDVGGGIDRTLKNMNDRKSHNKLEVLYHTASYPSHPFAFKSSMDERQKQNIINALLSMPDALLKSLDMSKFKITNDSQYDSVRDVAKKLKIMDR